MKRHPALIALSHDDHHALVEAGRLQQAAEHDDDPAPAAAAFADFFTKVNVPHLREVANGGATIAIGDDVRELGPRDAAIVDKGRSRKITAGRGDVRYLSVHLRRPPLQIASRVAR